MCLDIRTSEPTKTQKDNGADCVCSVILQQLLTAYCLGTHAGVPLLAWPGADQLAVVGRLVVTFGGPAIHHVAVGVLHHSGDAGVEAILRVLEARATIPQGACVREVDLTGVRRDGRSWTVFFVKALAAATGIADVGVAVDAPGGLVVPVVRAADRLEVGAISELVADLAGRARQGRLEPAEVSGGGITVTNVGGGGTLMAFPLVNPGQPAICQFKDKYDQPDTKSAQTEDQQALQ